MGKWEDHRDSAPSGYKEHLDYEVPKFEKAEITKKDLEDIRDRAKKLAFESEHSKVLYGPSFKPASSIA
jgi:hypothetical protein